MAGSSSETQQPSVASGPPGDDALFAGRSEMAARMRVMDWNETPLGPPLGWPQSLRSALSICLGSAFPIAIYWGAKLALLYNDAWSPIPGGKHPWALGRGAVEVWPEIWDTIGPMFEQVLTTGEATYSEDQILPMRRHGYTEECYFNFTFSPIRGESGRVEGIFNAVVETTYRVIGERRTRVLRDLGERTATARSAEEACTFAANTLGSEPRDAPFCALYLVDEAARVARLAACAGLVAGEPAAPATIALEEDTDETNAAPWPLARIRKAGRTDVVTGLDERLGALPSGSWPEAANAALVTPIMAGSAARAAAFLVLGVSPRRAVDDEYRAFAERAASQIGSAIATATAYELERKRAESLTELDRAKTAFFSNVSHEFRTPLTLMLGPAEEALSSPDRALRGPDLETVHRNALRLLKLVNNLLDFSRIEAGRAQVFYQRTDIATLTRDLASAFRSAIERGGVELVVDCAPVRQPVYLDRAMWEKIVLNLLSNAFKFTFEGTIRVGLREMDGRVELEVADSGVGIAAHELPRVFERFHRIEGARSRTHEGSGIGLALVHDLVRLHGGEIAVTSQLDRGTSFKVSLPTGSAHLPANRVSESPARAGSNEAIASFVAEAERWLPEPAPEPIEEAPAPAPGAELVLVADDNADMREYIVRLLGQRWNVVAVADGVQALAAARERPVDLILTDVMMPNLDGFGLIRALRAAGSTSRIPVIMLSARAGEESRIEGLQAGVDDYLVKPFSSKELMARVATHLELARARRQAEAERNRFQSLLLDIPAAVNFLRGPDLVFEFAHPITVKSLGGRAIEGKPVMEAMPENREQRYANILQDVLRTGIPQSGTEALVRVDRTNSGVLEDTYWNFTYLPVRSVTGEIEGVMTFDLEVTDQVLARRRIEVLMEELKATDRRKDEFLAMLAHELRNPLAPIQTSLYLLRKRLASSEFDRYLDVVERQAHNLARIVDDLLDVSRITRGKIELRKEQFDLAKAVARALDSLRDLIESRKHEVTVSLPDRPVPIEADPVRLDQVIINLLTNAAKYTDKGGRIAVSLEVVDGMAELRVRDNGIGIPADLLPHVFELFQQGGRDLARSQGGLGIGLTIVRRLIELHDGTVEARSEGSGKGSELIVRIPRVPEELPSAASDAQKPSGKGAVKGAVAHARVLIVDDNHDAAQSLAEVVEQYGHAARVAMEGVTALKLADEWQPDLVFLDIGLPGMDGYQVAQEFRKRVAYRPVLVALTGYGQESDRRASNEAGFAHHLVKPAQIRAVEEILATLGKPGPR